MTTDNQRRLWVLPEAVVVTLPLEPDDLRADQCLVKGTLGSSLCHLLLGRLG